MSGHCGGHIQCQDTVEDTLNARTLWRTHSMSGHCVGPLECQDTVDDTLNIRTGGRLECQDTVKDTLNVSKLLTTSVSP